VSVVSDPAAGSLRLSGVSDARSGLLDVWVPAAGAAPVLSGTNATGIQVAAVPGGYRVSARVTGSYQLSVTH
jgi:hypothetical protein